MTFTNYHIVTHTELGDLFVLQGLIRHYLQLGRRVFINTQPRYVDTAHLLFDNEALKVVATEKNYAEPPEPVPGVEKVIFLGYFSEAFQKHRRFWPGTSIKTFDTVSWDREFYRQAELPFLFRWTQCRLPLIDPERQIKGSGVMIHDDKYHRIDQNGTRIEPVAGGTIFDWRLSLIRAKEIHCIDSAVLSLVETMWACGDFGPQRPRLFFHKNVRKTHPPTMLAPWEVVE